MHSTLPWKCFFFHQTNLAAVAAGVLVPASPSGGSFLSQFFTAGCAAKHRPGGFALLQVLNDLGKNMQRQRSKQGGSRPRIMDRVWWADRLYNKEDILDYDFQIVTKLTKNYV